MVQVDAKAVADGDTVTVYVSTMDPRESTSVPRDVQVAAVQRSKARAERNYAKADALHKQIIDAGYRQGQHVKICFRRYLLIVASYVVQSTINSKRGSFGQKISDQIKVNEDCNK